jgi:hypothetical protein
MQQVDADWASTASGVGGAVCVLAGYAETTAAITAADKEPINVALNVFIRIPTPETREWILNRSLQRCQPLLTIDNRSLLHQTSRCFVGRAEGRKSLFFGPRADFTDAHSTPS